MAEGEPLDKDVVTLVMWAALIMNPCELKDVIDSAHSLT